MCMLFLKIPNISVLFGLIVETYGSTSSSFLVCVHVLKSESLGIDLAFFMLYIYEHREHMSIPLRIYKSCLFQFSTSVFGSFNVHLP